MQKLFENFRGWVNEQAAAPKKQQAQTKKMQLSFGDDAQCKYYTPEAMKRFGFPFDKTGTEALLHSFHLHLPIKNQNRVIAWIAKAYDKGGESRFYGIAPIAGGVTDGSSQLINFENGKVLPVGLNFMQALKKILSKVNLSLDQVELSSGAGAIPPKFTNFSVAIASGTRQVGYCKSTEDKKTVKKADQSKKTEKNVKEVETDDICNQELVLNVQKKFSKRLPGRSLKHADGKIIISICKIQRMLNNLGLNIEVDGIIGPQTVGALQKAYVELRPTGNKGEKSDINKKTKQKQK